MDSTATKPELKANKAITAGKINKRLKESLFFAKVRKAPSSVSWFNGPAITILDRLLSVEVR